MRDLRPDHWQIDEIWTFCRKKERHLTAEEQATGLWGDQYLFLAVGHDTKLVPAFVIGKRDERHAHRFMKDLSGRFRYSTFRRHRLSSDGFPPYPDAVRAAFNGKVDHGVMIKDYAANTVRLNRSRASGSVVEDDICTSHVERNNLTIRTMLRRYVRRTIAFSKKRENLIAAVALYLARYNFCWLHSTLGMTPAMAAGPTKHRWSLEQLLENAGFLQSSECV
jgi:IS1 family transposase